jgi:O-antigen/teichoic acid export membrane protein
MLAASRMTIVPLWVVSASASQDQAALFGTASRVAFTAVLPFGLVTAVVPPIIAELWARGERIRLENLLRTVAGVMLIPVSVVSVFLVLFGGRILSGAFGDFYADGAPVLAALVAGYWVNALSGSCGEVLMMTGHQRAMMLITLVSIVLLTVACLLVVDEYGVRGVAAATGVTFAVQNLLMVLAARRACGVWTHADLGAAFHRVRSMPELLRRS